MNATNKVLSIIAFYLSEFDMDAVNALGFKNRTEAISTISAKVGSGNNYLKLRCDEFDALPDSSSSRRGWRNRPPIKEVVEMASYLRQFSFAELTGIVQSLIENAEGSSPLEPEDHNTVSLAQMDEEEIERIANLSDETARLVYMSRAGNQRVYNRSIVTQLKKLYRGRCQICGVNPVAEFDADICEAHHIKYFSDSQNNDASNIIILCPNHHRLIHKKTLVFDSERMAFSADGKDRLFVKIDYHLKRT
ncbi:MAG: HNH endonuclease [Oscillospiraceae bacterium]|nr:HNH endonuclease [Oscillospiraceae bacterium]